MINDNTPAPAEPDARPKIVAIRGGLVLQPGEPNQQVVEALEAALAAAKSGALTGVAILESRSDQLVSGDWHGFWRKVALIGQCEILKSAVLAALDEECNPPEEDTYA